MQREAAPPHRPDRLRIGAGVLAFVALLVLTRPYRGIVQDAEIYVGQALAAADPAGLGRDILFAFDDQFRFSLWPAAARRLVAAFGPDGAAAGLAILGLAFWAIACVALASRLLPARLRLPGLLAAAALPPVYGGFGVFRYAEALATPRSLAEALVVAGLAGLLAGRRLLAFVLLAAATAVHPIMALPGIAVGLLLAAGSPRRGLVCAGLCAVAGFAGAAAGLPVLSRLLVAPDAAWAAGLGANAYLFPSRWPAASWCAVLLQLATILVARRSLAGPARAMAGAVGLVGAGGLLAALVGGDLLSRLLVLQVQPWRALWLASLFAALLGPVALVAGWREGGARSFAAALLAIAWIVPGPEAAAGFALLAVLLDARARRREMAFPRRLVGATWVAAGCLLAIVAVQRLAAAALLVVALPAGAGTPFDLAPAWLPLIAAAIVLAARPAPVLPRAIAIAGSLFLAGLAFVLADGRTRLALRLDAGGPDPALVRLLPASPGPVLWLGPEPRRAWVLAGRPNWVSYNQGAPMVFSRPLALSWTDRMDRLLAAGLADASDRSPHLARGGAPLRPDAAALAAFCSAPDAPLAIVVPLTGRVELPAGLPAADYRLPVPDVVPPGTGADLTGWARGDRHAVVTCRDPAIRRGARPGLRPGLDAG